MQKTTCSTAGPKTKPVTHSVVNSSDDPVEVFWLDYEGREQNYAVVYPGRRHQQPSYNTHYWRIRDKEGNVLVTHCGEASEFTVLGETQAVVVKPRLCQEIFQNHPDWGQYRQRSTCQGIPIFAFDVVGEDAVRCAAHVIEKMFGTCRKDVLSRLVEARADVAIIGRGQSTTDIPPHQYLKGATTPDGRCYDEGCRGLGGSPEIPTTSCAEENCTMEDDRRYASESILVHELAHAVMNIGMSEGERDGVREAFRLAKESCGYDPDCYMMSNADEYWAEGVQSWFGATERTDVNSGIKTRELLEQRDPRLAALIAGVFGAENRWRYTDDCPGKLRPYHGRGPPTEAPREHLVRIGGEERPSISAAGGGLLGMAIALGGSVFCCGAARHRPKGPEVKHL